MAVKATGGANAAGPISVYLLAPDVAITALPGFGISLAALEEHMPQEKVLSPTKGEEMVR